MAIACNYLRIFIFLIKYTFNIIIILIAKIRDACLVKL